MADRFSSAGLKQIQQAAADSNLLVSVISVWEVGLLESKNRIELAMDCETWIREALATPGLRLAGLTTRIALLSTRLPGEFHGDPADRFLMATARVEGARLMTKDREILSYGRKHGFAVISPS